MKVEGRITPPKGKDKHWAVSIPVLGIYTQGKSQRDAYRMAADAIESMVDERGFKVLVEPVGKYRFTLTSDQTVTFMAFVLSQLRVSQNLSARDMAKRLHSKSPNAYARYEQGAAVPTVSKLEELLKAIDPNLDIVIRSSAA